MCVATIRILTIKIPIIAIEINLFNFDWNFPNTKTPISVKTKAPIITSFKPKTLIRVFATGFDSATSTPNLPI